MNDKGIDTKSSGGNARSISPLNIMTDISSVPSSGRRTKTETMFVGDA